MPCKNKLEVLYFVVASFTWLLRASSKKRSYLRIKTTKIFYYFQKDVLQSFRSFRELLFLHINNTMVILLKAASIRVSSIQIIQVRVQNKSKSVWKSRYDRDVPTPPSLNLCLSSSISVDKLKVIKKNFYKLCLLLSL